MKNKTISKNIINENLPSDKKVEDILWEVQGGEEYSERAFSELQENNIIKDLNYKGESIKLRTKDGEDLGICQYAEFEDVLYLSWIRVCEPIQNCGIGTSLVSKCIERSKNKNIKKIYTLPKSSAAKALFKNFNFELAPEMGDPWKVKYLY
jgi:N-acetylglutamate synthase-like GNAT family acetyltransferase